MWREHRLSLDRIGKESGACSSWETDSCLGISQTQNENKCDIKSAPAPRAEDDVQEHIYKRMCSLSLSLRVSIFLLSYKAARAVIIKSCMIIRICALTERQMQSVSPNFTSECRSAAIKVDAAHKFWAAAMSQSQPNHFPFALHIFS